MQNFTWWQSKLCQCPRLPANSKPPGWSCSLTVAHPISLRFHHSPPLPGAGAYVFSSLLSSITGCCRSRDWRCSIG